ncbi:MAG: sensor histidine kinase [Ferruginibacter sp.]|nr:sensor histidine kinase [Ferruginibacter sp.]
MPKEITIFVVVVNVIILLLIAGIILFVLQHRKRRITHTKELLSTQLEMQQQTMQYIGREIHDNVGQKLTLASLYTQQLAYENKAPQVNDKIESISHIINESLTELRQLSKSLTDDSIADNTITALLQKECDKVNAAKKCQVHFSSNQVNVILPYQTKSILVRIVQEFLQNSIKHAGCENIDVSLSTINETVYLQLKDNGKGFNPEKVSGNGIGLNNMKKRTQLIGGSFRLHSTPQTGTKLNIEIPLQKKQ